MRIVAIASSIALLALVGCEEETTQPTGEEFQQERVCTQRARGGAQGEEGLWSDGGRSAGGLAAPDRGCAEGNSG